MKVFITGLGGFVGSGIYQALSKLDTFECSGSVRRQSALSAFPRAVHIPDISSGMDLSSDLYGVDVVIHAAARVHVMNDSSEDPLAEFRRVNVRGSLELARQAVRCGVRRFIFISSIKVNGEQTLPGQCFSADDDPMPVDPYGISKLEAEQALIKIGQETGLEVVIIRPVLIYGPGVKGNFRSMINWLRRGVPLPLGSVRNRRSILALENLIDLVRVCLTHPEASGEVFLASDAEPVSTPDLLRMIGDVLDRPARIVSVPVSILLFLAKISGRGSVAQRVLGSLQVDISKNYALLGWRPVLSTADAIKKSILTNDLS